jgi:hypothetical protein
MPPPQPPRRPTANTEGRGNFEEIVKPSDRFKNFARKLIEVSREEFQERERAYELSKKSLKKGHID